ncbi:MAG: hypothetical protein IPM12_14170 [Flavobacteriales bacterium]|nr:hypothetical protein [Flavobacteriales bacterium]
MELERNAAGDSLHWSWHGTHEGGTEAVLGFRPANKVFAGEPAGDPLNGWSTVRLAADTGQDAVSLWLSDSGAPLQFVRITSEQECINSLTVAGRYQHLRDSVVVEISANGSLLGLDTITRYEVHTDFALGMEAGDVIFLYGPGLAELGIAHRFTWIGNRLRLDQVPPAGELQTVDPMNAIPSIELERLE